MLTEKQILEIREHLEKAQNPVFFFDNDQDGLCSFLLLQRFLGRGKGVPIKSFPQLNENHFRKVTELNADYIFVLDKPSISEEFLKKVHELNLPVVWIDHHSLDDCLNKKIPKFVYYYNSFSEKEKSGEPVTVICWEVVKRKQDIWLAVAGAISDKFFPEFYPEFERQYPELSIDSINAFEIFYKSEIGKIARIIGAGLKDKTTNVIRMLKFLMNVDHPYKVLEKTPENKIFHERFEYFEKKLKKHVENALRVNKDSENLFYYEYGGEMSISADLANYFSFLFPKRDVVVVYVSGAKANISGRGKGIRTKILKAIEGLGGATGGGHEDAVGAMVLVDDLEKFKERLSPISK